MNLMEHWKMKIIRIDNLILNADNITAVARPFDKCCITVYGAGMENGVNFNYSSFEQRDKDYHKLSYLFSEL